MFRRTGPGHRSIQGGSDKRLPAFRSTIGRVVENCIRATTERQRQARRQQFVRQLIAAASIILIFVSGFYLSNRNPEVVLVSSIVGEQFPEQEIQLHTGQEVVALTRDASIVVDKGRITVTRRADFRPVTRSKQQQTRCSLRPTSYPYVGRWDESVAQFRHGARISGRICRTYPGYHGKRRDIP